jgi:hypothetical protein
VAQALSIRLDVSAMSRAQSFIHEAGPRNVQLAAQSCREVVALDAHFLGAWHCRHEALGTSQTWGVDNVIAARREQQVVGARIVSLAPDAWRTQPLRAEE